MTKKHAHPLDKLSYQDSITIGTLAAKTGIIGAPRTLLQDYKAFSLQGSIVALGWSAADDEYLIYGICSADLTLAQIEQYLEDPRVRKADTTGEEIMSRPIQILGLLDEDKRTDWHQLLRLRLPTFQEDVGFNWFVYNPSTSAHDAGIIVSLQWLIFGRWLN